MTKQESFTTRVVGVTFEERQQVVASLAPGEALQLRREPHNVHDSNAIRVERLNGQQIGYISAPLAKEITPRLDRMGGIAPATAVEKIGGGPHYNYGVVISFRLLAPPIERETRASSISISQSSSERIDLGPCEDATDPNGTSQKPIKAAANIDLESLLQEGYGFSPLKRGEVREGIIVSISPSEILIDLSGRTEGVVSGWELERMPKEILDSISVGDEVMAYVVNPQDINGNIVLSLTRAQLEKDWLKAKRLFESQGKISAQATFYNKGGLIVCLGMVRGFVPASQLDTSRHPRLSEGGLTPEERWGHLVGETLQLKVIEIDRERNRLILSERAAMREWRKMQKEMLLSDLTEGEIREGKVISLADFGAFADLGGADGLIHLSELSWKRVNHPREVLKVGETVTVYVLNVDRERRRIGLSLKRLQPDPWTLVDENYAVDQLVEGVITKLAKFGAFACIVGDEEIEGLIHISELSEDHIAHPKEVVQEGQVVTLRVIRIDTDQRRMGLSLKQVDQAKSGYLAWRPELATAQEETPEVTTAEIEATEIAEADIDVTSEEEPAMAIDDLLKRGIAALKTGHQEEARNLLTQVVQQDGRNETAWLWLSGAVDADEERRTCLQNVLIINPSNNSAKRGIAFLDSR